MKKIYLTSALSFLLISQTSMHALNPKNIINIPYKLLFGGLSTLQIESSLIASAYTCFFALIGKKIYKLIQKERQNKQKTTQQKQVANTIPQEKTAFSNQTKNRFDDPYNAPTQEEWDAFWKKNESKTLENKNNITKDIKEVERLQKKNSVAQMAFIGMWENTRKKITRFKNNH